MKGYVNTNIGEVSINEDVIASYAGSAAIECFGIVGMASLSMISGLATLLKKDNLSKGVEIIIENVTYKVEEFTGMKVKNIFVYVEGVRVVD